MRHDGRTWARREDAPPGAQRAATGMKTAVGAPAPRPTIEELIEAIAKLSVREILVIAARIRDLSRG